jgi:hypothetical protein
MFLCVRHLLTAMCLFTIACYEAPDYAATHFKCDIAHVCPGDQRCVNSVCMDGAIGSGGSDAGAGVGVDGGAPAQVGVACGAVTCAAAQQCCVDFMSVPHCQAPGASCDGVVAGCDGIEDCGGKACCEAGVGLAISCGGATTCPSGYDEICRDATDCTDPGTRQCCFGVGFPGEPWGRCRPGCPPP